MVLFLFIRGNEWGTCVLGVFTRFQYSKKYNIWCHYETYHATNTITCKEKIREKVNKMLADLKKQQSALIQSQDIGQLFKIDPLMEVVVQTFNFI